MPKIDLHCHLDGSMNIESMGRILGRPLSEREVQVPDDCESLAEYLEKFDLPLTCIQTENGLKESARQFLLDLQKDDIVYVEVRFAPQLSVSQGLNCGKIMEAVLDGLKAGKAESGIEYQVITCMMSHHDEKTNLQMLKECRPYLGEGLCAVDLAGNEAGFPREIFRPLFEEAKRLDYPFTIHSGECGNANNIKMAVEWGAQRIGHGIAMAGNPEIQELCRKKRVGIEMCPISNYQTKALQKDEVYPIREFADAGLLVTVNTDNRTVSNTSIEKEVLFLQERFGITAEELKQYQRNAIDVAFCHETTKHKLWKMFK